MLVIGNTIFTSSVQYDMSSNNMSSFYIPLRGAPIILPSNKSISAINLTIDFATPYHIQSELIPLIAMFRTTPLVPVQYEPIQRKMGLNDSHNILCGLKSLEVTTVPNTFGYLRANVELAWCNWDGLANKMELNRIALESFVQQTISDYAMEYGSSGDLTLHHALISPDVFISASSTALVLASIKFSVANTFAVIPILGQVYPRLQHVGGTLIGGSMAFQSPGPDHTSLSKVTGFMESLSKVLITKYGTGKDSTGRKRLVQTTVTNNILNMCGLTTIIMGANALAEIPDTMSGMEYSVEFYDGSSIDRYDGPKLAFTRISKSEKDAIIIVNRKMLEDDIYSEAIKKRYPKAYEVFEEYKQVVPTKSVAQPSPFSGSPFDQSRIPGGQADPSLTHQMQEQYNPPPSPYEWESKFVPLSEESAYAVRSKLEERDPSFLSSDLMANEIPAVEVTVPKGDKSYADLNLRIGQNPYDIFFEEHTVDYEGVQDINAEREKLFRGNYKCDEKFNIIPARPELKQMVNIDLSNFLTHDYRTNRFSELYPAFKLYIVETDSPYDIKFADDLYVVETVNELSLIQSKELPAATLVVKIHNLWNQYAVEGMELIKAVQQSERGESIDINVQGTEVENKIDKIPIAPGIRVQLRYGFENDAALLPIIFNGRIKEVATENNVISIIAEDSGSYLANPIGEVPGLVRCTANEKGNKVDLYTSDPDDIKLLKSLQDNVFEKVGVTRGDMLALYYILRAGADDFIYPPLSMWFTRLRYKCRRHFKKGYMPTISDPPTLSSWEIGEDQIVRDHITRNVNMPAYIPMVKGAKPPPDIIGFIYNTTAWDLLNELVDLYPGTCVSTRPYENETTIFIGDPDTSFVVTRNAVNATATNQKEMHKAMVQLMGSKEQYKKFVQAQIEAFITQNKDADTKDQQELIALLKSAFDSEIGWTLADTKKMANPEGGWYNPYNEPFAYFYKRFMTYLMQYCMKFLQESYELSESEMSYAPTYEPLRRMHFADSTYNMTFNNIQESADVYNAIAVNWVSATSPGGQPVHTPENEVMVHIPQIKAEWMRVEHYQPKTAYNREMATRLGVSLLCKEFGHAYDGEFGMISTRHIRPYDFVYISDRVNGLYGSVEVRDSILFASKEQGVMYVIVPDLIVRHSNVSVNDYVNNYWFADVEKMLGKHPIAKSLVFWPYLPALAASVYGHGEAGVFQWAMQDPLQMIILPLLKTSGSTITVFLEQAKKEYFGKMSGKWEDIKREWQRGSEENAKTFKDFVDSFSVGYQ